MKCRSCSQEADPMYVPYCYDCGQELEAMNPNMFYRINAKYLRRKNGKIQRKFNKVDRSDS